MRIPRTRRNDDRLLLSGRNLPMTPLLYLVNFLVVVVATLLALPATAAPSQHTENYAVIVSSSRYWFNYRHTVNALTLYRMLRDEGNYTDDRIILMLADEYAINPRNPYKNFITSSSSSGIASSSLYTADVEIDYRGDDVTVENLARVLTGRSRHGAPVVPAHTPQANLLVYVTGHGGDKFFKFQDVEEVLASQLAALLRQRTSHRILFIADTCQAFTLGDHMDVYDNDDDTANNDNKVIMIGSSLRDESSYAHHSNAELGLALIERYTHAVQQYFAQQSPKTDWRYTTSLYQALVEPYSFASQRAHIGIRPASMAHTTDLVVADFFVNRAAQSDTPPTAQWWKSPPRWTVSTDSSTPLSTKQSSVTLPPPFSPHNASTWNDKAAFRDTRNSMTGMQDAEDEIISVDVIILAAVLGLLATTSLVSRRLSKVSKHKVE